MKSRVGWEGHLMATDHFDRGQYHGGSAMNRKGDYHKPLRSIQYYTSNNAVQAIRQDSEQINLESVLQQGIP